MRISVRSFLSASILCVSIAVAAPSSAEKSAKALQTSIAKGDSALASQDFATARDAYADALTIDPHNVVANSGLGNAYAGLKNYPKAAPLLDKAVASEPNDRLAVFNAAAVHIDSGTAMRGAKLIKDFLEAHPSAPDEPLGNALAIALAATDEQARKNSFYQSAAAFYKTYSAKLEAAAPGMKRWGIEWVSASDFADKQTDITSKQTRLNDANKAVADGNDKLESLKTKLAAEQQRVQSGVDTADALDDINNRISEQQEKLTKAVADRDSIVASIPAPTVPTTLDLATAATLPPAGIIGQTPAVETPPPQVATGTPAPKPRRKKPNSNSTPTDSNTGGASTDPPIVPKGTSNQHVDTPIAPDAPAEETPQPKKAKTSIVVQYAAAFPVAPDLLVTSATVVRGASKIDLLNSEGNPMSAQVVRKDDASGLALLRLTSQKMSFLSLADDFKGGPVQCAAFTKVDLFNPAPEMITGTTPAPAIGWTIQLSKLPHIPGAPLLDSGKIVGVQLGDRDSDVNAIPAVTLAQLKTFIGTELPTTKGNATAASVMLQLSATKTVDAQ